MSWLDRKDVFSRQTSNWSAAEKAHQTVVEINEYQKLAMQLGIKPKDTREYIGLLARNASRSARAAQYKK